MTRGHRPRPRLLHPARRRRARGGAPGVAVPRCTAVHFGRDGGRDAALARGHGPAAHDAAPAAHRRRAPARRARAAPADRVRSSADPGRDAASCYPARPRSPSTSAFRPRALHVAYCHTPPRFVWEPDEYFVRRRVARVGHRGAPGAAPDGPMRPPRAASTSSSPTARSPRAGSSASTAVARAWSTRRSTPPRSSRPMSAAAASSSSRGSSATSGSTSRSRRRTGPAWASTSSAMGLRNGRLRALAGPTVRFHGRLSDAAVRARDGADGRARRPGRRGLRDDHGRGPGRRPAADRVRPRRRARDRGRRRDRVPRPRADARCVRGRAAPGARRSPAGRPDRRIRAPVRSRPLRPGDPRRAWTGALGRTADLAA